MDTREKAISDFIGLVKSWIPWRSEPPCVSRDFWMPDESCRVCYDCDSQFTVINRRHHCRICGRIFCARCTSHSLSILCESNTGIKEWKKIRVCKYCFKQWPKGTPSFELGFQNPPSLASFASSESSGVTNYKSLNTEHSLNHRTSSSVSYNSEIENFQNKQHCEEPDKNKDDSLQFHDSNHYATRSDDYDEEYRLCCSDSDTAKFVEGNCCYSQLSDSEFGESHQTSPNQKYKMFDQGIGHSQSNNEGYIDDEAMATNSIYSLEDVDSEPVDFENNAVLWLPPEPEDEEDEKSMSFYDDEDETYSSLMSVGHGEEQKNTMKNVVGYHFRSLVGQLLQVENVSIVEEDGEDNWLDIITYLSWEAATLLKPDTSKSAGMDPGGYVKVKCVASGRRRDSVVVKGVVCKKNVAHRKMISMIERPRILILGGAVEYQRVTNHLSSLDTLLQQEIDYLKMAVAKIDAQHPNVLLVEKSVSRFAQDCLLAKGISLVLNIKKPLLERIARCSGSHIVPSIDHISFAKLGHCEKLYVKRFFEDLGSAGQGGKKLAKNLMYFEGCPKPFGFTILLRGANGDELKKVKHVIQYGVFAAYHLALETSFLADEGASLPDQPFNSPISVDFFVGRSNAIPSSFLQLGNHFKNPFSSSPQQTPADYYPPSKQSSSSDLLLKEEFPPSPSDHQSILVSLSSRCVWKGSVCEKAHLFRIKHYGTFDKPLGRFLRDHLFDQGYTCHACGMPSEAHVYCYTHRQGTLTISVKKLPETILPGESDGRIWMWHRCLKCPRANNFPPATRRVVMSDAAWGLSFGKFLELSFSNHASASRVASCGHSLHRDCLRFYGFGNMVACFRYSSIDVLSVCVPPSKLEFTRHNQRWIDNELLKVVNQAEAFFSETRNSLTDLSERKVPDIVAFESTLQNDISEFGNVLNQEDQFVDILEINKLQRQLVYLSWIWSRRLHYLSRNVTVSNSEDATPEMDGPDEADAGWLKSPLSSLDWKIVFEHNQFTKEMETKHGARLMLPVGAYDTVIPVYDDEPTSVISYALTLPEYHAQLTDEAEAQFSSEPVFPVDEPMNDSHRSSSSVEESLLSMSSSLSVLIDPISSTKALHIKVNFGDDGPLGKVRYSVTCYYAKCFDKLRRLCCPSAIDFVRCLSRCKKWGAQGGKSNVFFAKTLDDRLIIKQVTKTELDSFVKFGPEYFKYLSESMATRSPTCLAKILGIYQVSAKHGKGSKETKRDLLVMENLLFDRKVKRVYDLKGSSRSRYNADVSGANNVLLDQNLMEALPTSPIFVTNKAKRLLERAVWNDTSFLASVDVMDYSLLVGLDDDNHQLVVGIIDFMRQYTWDKHLETWVKTTGILGGAKNTSPTVISPMHYKKRFRKAMTAYFLMVPHQWSQSY